MDQQAQEQIIRELTDLIDEFRNLRLSRVKGFIEVQESPNFVERRFPT